MKRILVVAGVVCSVALSPLLLAQDGPQPWQQSWSEYGAELGKQLGAGVSPHSELVQKIFDNKSVSWEGALMRPFKGEPKETLLLSMDTIECPVACNLFPSQSGVSGVIRVKVERLTAQPAESAVDEWKNMAVGSMIRFRANTGTSPISLVTMGTVGDTLVRGALILFVEQAEPITQ